LAVFETFLANFGKFTIHEPRRCRSELHTSRDRKRKLRIFEASRSVDTPLRPCRRRITDSSAGPKPHVAESFKAASNVFVAEEQTLDDPRDLTDKATAQTAFSYTPRSARAGFLYQTGGVNS
jgi:hypothetical protein